MQQTYLDKLFALISEVHADPNHGPHSPLAARLTSILGTMFGQDGANMVMQLKGALVPPMQPQTEPNYTEPTRFVKFNSGMASGTEKKRVVPPPTPPTDRLLQYAPFNQPPSNPLPQEVDADANDAGKEVGEPLQVGERTDYFVGFAADVPGTPADHENLPISEPIAVVPEFPQIVWADIQDLGPADIKSKYSEAHMQFVLASLGETDFAGATPLKLANRLVKKLKNADSGRR